MQHCEGKNTGIQPAAPLMAGPLGAGAAVAWTEEGQGGAVGGLGGSAVAGVKKTKKIKALNPADILDAVPVQNHAARVEKKGAGVMVIYVPLKRAWFMGPPVSWLIPVRRERGIELDRLGQEIWDACDGKQRVERIIEIFADRHHLRFHEARVSVMAFLRQLTQRGALVVVGFDSSSESVAGEDRV